jgi:hypothetical protein
MKLSVAFMIALAIAGCSTSPIVQTRTVEIVSSKPYRFITWTPADSAETKKQVRAHNRAHQEVIDQEKKK